MSLLLKALAATSFLTPLHVEAQSAGDPELPDVTLLLEFSTDNAMACTPSTSCGSPSFVAGEVVTDLSLDVPSGFYFMTQAVSNATFVIVNSSVDDALLLNDPLACMPNESYVAGSAVVRDSGSAFSSRRRTPGDRFGATVEFLNPAAVAGGFLKMAMGSPQMPLRFYMGGKYKLCYSQDGYFGSGMQPADVLPHVLEVWGAYDEREECKEDPTCLTTKRHRCYVLKGSYNNPQDSLSNGTSCIVDYSYPGSGLFGLAFDGGDYPKASWSEEWTAAYTAEGMQASLGTRGCGTLPARFLCHSPDQNDNTTWVCSGDDYIRPEFDTTHTPDGFRLHMPPATNRLLNLTDPRFGPRTVAACYCPYQYCSSDAEYKQQVGILMYFATKVCYNGFEGERGCYNDFNGATPQHRFSVRILCPPGGCAGNTFNMMKIVAQHPDNELPSYATSFFSSVTGCATAQHGINMHGKIVLPEDDNVNVTSVNGRERQDYKLWNYKQNNTEDGLDISNPLQSGYMFDMGESDYEKLNAGSGETMDVCYCDDDCDVAGNWFKVGQVRFVPFRLVSSLQATSDNEYDWSIEYAFQPGILGFYRAPQDRGVMGLQDNAMVKLVADEFNNITDVGCKDPTDGTTAFDPKYDEDLVFPGPLITYDYKTAYDGYQGMTNTTISENRFFFNGGDPDAKITVRKAGFLAVCYCSSHVLGTCLNNHWVLAAHMTIRGPRDDHSWRVSTNVVFRLDINGWGLSSNDNLRIVPDSVSCLDSSEEKYGPRGAYTLTNIKLKCPHPCSEVGEPTSELHGGIEVQVFADDAYACNDQNADCRHNDIKAVQVLDEHRTELEFEKVHGLETGDMISLTENFICHPEDTVDECNDARLAVLMGVFPYYDKQLGEALQEAPDTYFAGHIVTVTDSKKVTIPVGWPTAPDRPRFWVKFANNKKGRWHRHSKASTKLEIMGTRAYENMRVCWGYKRDPLVAGQHRYTSQVGLITLEDPNVMIGAFVTLTSLVKNQENPWSPFIISFSTAGSETGKQYGRVQGMTRVQFLLPQSTSALEGVFQDGAIIEQNNEEGEMVKAKQYICGKIFREMWSSDAEIGFPLPRGCYYTRYGTTQEINILFDRKNGLKAGQDYQMVMYGTAMEGAIANAPIAQLMTMDDVELHPYSAIERGSVLLRSAPVQGAYGSDGVAFFPPEGVKVFGGGLDMMELSGSAVIKMAFKGNPAMGGIKASSILRIFLWPLTQWDVALRCTAQCIPFDDVSNPCGAVQDCRGDSLVPNFNRNYLKIVFPVTMSTMNDEVSHTIELSGLIFPKGGFFPTRFGFELRRADDTKPDYMENVGDYFMKEPDQGASVGKLVEYWGDGDHKPFRGDKGNVLYAQIMLASTLFAALQTNDAEMTIILPPGYECIYPPTESGEQQPWQAPDNLGVFGDTIPQGTGAPFEASAWSGRDNTCKYELRQNGVIYAGSSLMIRITVNNPEEALKRTDNDNRWQVVLASKGYYNYKITFPAVVFGSDAESGAYSSQKPVLGRITDAKIIPGSFAISQDIINVQISYAKIFFRTQQDTGVSAQVRISAPSGFRFPNPCSARDIPLEPFNYYITYSSGVGSPTKRLPGIISCEHVSWPGQTEPSHVAAMVSGSLLPNTYYGFELLVQNSFGYEREERNDWEIFTTDMAGNRVDGTPKVNGTYPEPVFNTTVGMAAIDSSMVMEPSFGVYQRSLHGSARPINVEIDSMTPSRVAGPTKISMGFQVPGEMNGVSTTLRIVAPEGFVWRCDAHFDSTGLSSPDIQENNVLIWEAMTYLSIPTYTFECHIEIPDQSPTHSLNEFIFEMGHRGRTLGERYAASTVAAPKVNAVASVFVDYTQNTALRDPPNEISFQFETTTSLQEGQVVHIEGPVGFDIARQDSVCMPAPAGSRRGSPYEVISEKCCPTAVCPQRCTQPMSLPQDMTCTLRSYPLYPVDMILVAGSSGLPAGLYSFMVQAVNPGDPTPNPEDMSSPCDHDQCWTVSTKADSSVGAEMIDVNMSYPAFDVKEKLVEGGLSELTDQQIALTGRDDRPLSKNQLVMYFSTNKQMLNPETLEIRAPKGYVFDEDCLSSVEVRGHEVYGGSGEELPLGDTPWPLDVELVSCRGEGPNAYIRTNPGVGDGFLPYNRYPFRIAVYNPKFQPDFRDNKWVIAYGDEASRPFNGFMLWTFKRTLAPPIPASIGAAFADSSKAKLWNPVTFTFAPHNAISGAGMRIEVLAPPQFEIARDTTRRSRILVQPVSEVPGPGVGEVPPEPKYDSRPSQIWGEDEIDALVPDDDPRQLIATILSNNRELEAGRDYQITIFVYNPIVTVEVNKENEWTLQTFNSRAASPVLPLFRDRINLPGFAIVDTPRSWLLRNEEPSTGRRFYNGLERVKQLYFEMQFPSKMETNKTETKPDRIVIHTPAGYKWLDCNQEFTWEPPRDAELYLPQSPRKCVNGVGPLDRSNLTFTIAELIDIPAMRLIKFRMDAQNPEKTPHAMLNQWMLTHYNGESGRIMSTTAAVSWAVIPQLANVVIELVGTGVPKAAGSKSRMAISFVPISEADELFIQAREPLGFDFTGCRTISNGNEIIATDLDKVRVRAAVTAGIQADIVIDDFTLGQLGGQTQFDLITRLNNGEQMDEALNFRDGFILPGDLRVVNKSIGNIFTMNPADFPGDRDVRMNERATVKFVFTVTLPADPLDLISFYSPQYTLLPDNFEIRRQPEDVMISSEVVSYIDGNLVAQLQGSQIRRSTPGFSCGHEGVTCYEVSIDVTTPNLPSPSDSMWQIELRKQSANPLPLNTNDGRTDGFRLVDNVRVSLVRPPSNEAPPVAEVDVELIVDPRSARPDELILLAPPFYNFTENCLVRPGDAGEFVSCTPTTPDPSGRAAAKLITKAGGLTGPTDYVVIRITTPAQDSSDPEDRKWFMSAWDSATQLQLGWGEDEIGLNIRQMPGAQVVFSGIPQISGQMSMQFYTNLKVDAGGKIRLYYPRSIVIMCDGDFLHKVALEGEITCNNFARLGYLDLVMERPMVAGQQAFCVTAAPPDAISEVSGNIFRILVYTPENKVLDAAMNVPGNNIEHGVKIAVIPLIWGASLPGAASSASVGFELLEDLPLKDPPIMSEIVVTLPVTFEQRVRRASHIEVLGEPLPLRGDNWLVVDHPRKVVIKLDETAVKTLPIGRYRFSFPIMLPSRFPKYNVYHVTICKPNPPGVNETCSGDPQDPRALTTFPLAGFNLGEEHPSAKIYMAAAAGTPRFATPPSGMLAAAVLAVAVWSAVAPATGGSR